MVLMFMKNILIYILASLLQSSQCSNNTNKECFIWHEERMCFMFCVSAFTKRHSSNMF